jgi:hypothetical protein
MAFTALDGAVPRYSPTMRGFRPPSTARSPVNGYEVLIKFALHLILSNGQMELTLILNLYT